MATIASIIKIPMKAEEKKPRRFLDCTISTIVRKTADYDVPSFSRVLVSTRPSHKDGKRTVLYQFRFASAWLTPAKLACLTLLATKID